MATKQTENSHFESLYPEASRDMEIDKILDYVKKGNSVELIGLPGVGRSNLLRVLAYNNSVRVKHLRDTYKWFHFVYMDLSEIRGRSLFDLTKFILISLSYSFSERKMAEEQKAVNDILHEAVGFKDDLILFQALKKAIDYLSLEKELTVVLLFDRFDTYFPNLTPEFFTNLRVLRNRAKYRFSCIFSLSRPLEDLLETAMYTEFYDFLIGNIVYLPVFDSEINKFRLSYLEKAAGKKTSEEIKEEIVVLAGGHGKLSRISLESILSEDKKIQDDKALTAFLLSKPAIKGALLEVWNALTPQEQKAIQKNELENIQQDSYLALCGLVNNGSIQIPLLANYLPNLPQPATEKIVFLSETNEIKQGEETLTDKLSPSEFKLLRFLIQNKDRVCEKEEIINTVWTDAKTQMGVTDQALDQIVYRLRKKIETDPNNPTHLHTVKGRGYKFTE